MREEFVLCASSAYEQKYYFNNEFSNLPDQVKDELKAMCVLFTEDVGGILELKFDGEGTLSLVSTADEEDVTFDEIGAGLKIRNLTMEKRDLFEALELYYKVFFLESEES